MMAKDWVKVHVSMLFHEQTQTLPAEAFRAWVNMLLYAGLIDDGGRLGPAPSVAYALHIAPGEIAGILGTLNGRIIERDGELHIRDWSEWQAKSPAERKADQRSREAGPCVDCHDASRDVTARHAESRLSHISDQSDQLDQSDQPENKDNGVAPLPGATQPPAEQVKPKRVTRPRAETPHMLAYGAVCDACCLDAALLDTDTAANVGRLATRIVDRGITPEYVRQCGDRWRTEKFANRRPADVKPPGLAQFKTWMGECITADKQRGNGLSGPDDVRYSATDDEIDAKLARHADPAVIAWRQVRAILADTVAGPTFTQWYTKLEPVSLADGVLSVRPPTDAVAAWLTSRGADALADAGREVGVTVAVQR